MSLQDDDWRFFVTRTGRQADQNITCPVAPVIESGNTAQKAEESTGEANVAM